MGNETRLRTRLKFLGDKKMRTDIAGHFRFLKKICLEKNAKIILELGVREGESTKKFLEICDILNAKLISIDTGDCSAVSNNPRWKFLQMNDLDYEVKEPIDILFIDTEHTYKQTLLELKKFIPHVKSGGVILLHDTISCPGVLEAIKKYLKSHKNLKFKNRKNSNGLGVIWKNQSFQSY